jgi:Domain of unknown function (DUF4340)
MNPRTTGILALIALALGAFVYFYEIEGESGREAERAAEKRVFAGLEPEDVESIELKTNDGVAARFERKEGAWRIVEPVEGAGDAMALDGIASALTQLERVESVESPAGDLAQFGLGPDAKVVRFQAAGAPHVLRIGRATPVGGNVYVAAGGPEEEEAAQTASEGDAAVEEPSTPDVKAKTEVVYVERYRLNALEHSLTELRDRKIAALEPESLRRLALAWSDASGPVSLVLEREEGDWQIREPIAARADQETVRTLLSNLQYLQASGFVDERTPAVDAALAETAFSVTPTADEASAPATIRFAGLFDGSRLVEVGQGALFLVAPERLDDFARELAAYRDRQLVDLASTSLAKIEIELASGEPAITLTRGAESWSGGERAIDSDAVASLAEQLASLRAEAIVADEMGEAELASLGLAPPAVRIRLFAAGADAADGNASDADAPAQPISLEFGRVDSERGLFVRRAGEATIYVLAASLAETLPLDAASFEVRFGKAAAESDETEAEAEAP